MGVSTGIIQYDPLRTVIYSSPVQRLTYAALINRQYNQCNRLVHEKAHTSPWSMNNIMRQFTQHRFQIFVHALEPADRRRVYISQINK